MEQDKAQDVKGNLIDAVQSSSNGDIPTLHVAGHAAKADVSDILAGIAATNVTYKAATIKYKFDFNDDKANFRTRIEQADAKIAYYETLILKLKASTERVENNYQLAGFELLNAVGAKLIAAQKASDKAFNAMTGNEVAIKTAINKARAAKVARQDVQNDVIKYAAMSVEEYDKRRAAYSEHQSKLERYKASKIKAQ